MARRAADIASDKFAKKCKKEASNSLLEAVINSGGFDWQDTNPMEEIGIEATSAYIRGLEEVDESGMEDVFMMNLLPSDMDSDELNQIFTEFLHNRGDRINEFRAAVPTLRGLDYSRLYGEDLACRATLVGLLYGGSKCGDEYSKTMLKTIYRTYYKKEYNILKKRHELSAHDLSSFCDPETAENIWGDDRFDKVTYSRIFCMGRVMGIKMSKGIDLVCGLVQSSIIEEREFFGGLVAESYQTLSSNEGWYAKEKERFDSIISSVKKTEDGSFVLIEKMMRVIQAATAHEHIHDTAIADLAKPDMIMDSMRDVLYIMDGFGLKFDLAPEIELQYLGMIYSLMRCTAVGMAEYKDRQDTLLYREAATDAENPIIKAMRNTNAAEITTSRPQFSASKEKEQVKEEEKEADASDPQEEIKKLKEKLHEAENDSAHFRSLYEKEKEEKEALLEGKEERETEKKELIALREYVYNETEEDYVPEKEISYEEMKEAVKDKRVVIIGGNDNWIKRIRNLCPGWRIISANVSPSISRDIVYKADMVYFFSDTLGHTNYYKFVDILRAHDIKFSYMHGVNPTRNISQVYCDLCEGK